MQHCHARGAPAFVLPPCAPAATGHEPTGWKHAARGWINLPQRPVAGEEEEGRQLPPGVKEVVRGVVREGAMVL